ncbi:hypothetical protein WL90_20805 [Burkholderia cenocepacia]|jgi:hypothetical protein|nr:hypothetical protein WL90_20805 [Burkholderia cenocepacia]KWF74079.1 hypothetical protein WL89_32050 [Burkholderia cenocepacia]
MRLECCALAQSTHQEPFSQILGSLLENVPCLTYELESCASARVLLRKTATAGVARELMDLTKYLVDATHRTLDQCVEQIGAASA